MSTIETLSASEETALALYGLINVDEWGALQAISECSDKRALAVFLMLPDVDLYVEATVQRLKSL